MKALRAAIRAEWERRRAASEPGDAEGTRRPAARIVQFEAAAGVGLPDMRA